MALETKIWINKLNVQFSLSGLENVITSITASMSGRDTHGKDVFIEDEGYTISAPVLSAFTAFESLTESDCINFVKASPEYDTLYDELTARVEEQQPVATQSLCALPWG